jgi:A/G-specific adenine glycosylase
MHKKKFAQKIIRWFREHKRILPWRETRDPYKIWLSEIILQQTRVAQGFPYYLKFIERFPDVFTLASAKEQEVLRLWQGLGYYTRAGNLHRCAKVIVKEHFGEFPDTFNELQKLPGIGVYTAAAIASIAFGEPVAVVDGNVYRVLARIFGIVKNIASSQGKDYFSLIANEMIPDEHPDEFNQAMMEFGATHCLPRNPKCDTCIFKKECIAFARNEQSRFPVKKKKLKSRKRYFFYFVLQQGNRLMMRKREGKDIWHGLYDFYSVETKRSQKTEKIISQSDTLKKIGDKIEVLGTSAVYKHILSHQTLFARFISVKILLKNSLPSSFLPAKLKSYQRKEVGNLPKPALVSRYLSDIGFL